ncbi:hypothetical protein HDF24_13830 [Mucilaginibacter sp. X4EP1]|jgi:hypothetical protein|uniref:hypothetical protein n=1 Tax=Mucilaginibacter sp. X4EP1 TaxID=2723092 RepID=UPI0021676274|nr:hypothetical protein [Mucilaginibacter sp. X4EP1]MCS3814643.1 hypothetical protein [Mucilaginibacter sp. X4EP1]
MQNKKQAGTKKTKIIKNTALILRFWSPGGTSTNKMKTNNLLHYYSGLGYWSSLYGTLNKETGRAIALVY